MVFADRSEAGSKLADSIRKLDLRAPVVVGIAKGGIAVGREVARALAAPLDLTVATKIRGWLDPFETFGAVSEENGVVLNDNASWFVDKDPDRLRERILSCGLEARRLVKTYRDGVPPLDLRQRAVVLVDDGAVSGYTAAACAKFVRERGARTVLFAAPTATEASLERIGLYADTIVVLQKTAERAPVSSFYRDFSVLADDEVRRLFEKTLHPNTVDVEIETPEGVLTGELTVPFPMHGLVFIVHGTAPQRGRARNVFLARTFHNVGLGTFQSDVLSTRLDVIVQWYLAKFSNLQAPLGFLGAGDGGETVVRSVATMGHRASAVVLRGVDLDRVAAFLPMIMAPTLIIAGGDDAAMVEASRRALGALTCHGALETIPGASCSFQEPGALEAVAHLATDWFLRYFGVQQEPFRQVTGVL